MKKLIFCVAVIDVGYRVLVRAYVRRALGVTLPPNFDRELDEALREWAVDAT